MILAVPGCTPDHRSRGTHRLIRNLVASYPKISLSAMDKEDREQMLQSLEKHAAKA